MRLIYAKPLSLFALAVGLVSSCGQDPSFVDASLTQGAIVNDGRSDDAVAAEVEDFTGDQSSSAVSDESDSSAGDSRNPVDNLVVNRPVVATAPAVPSGPATNSTGPIVIVQPSTPVAPVVAPTPVVTAPVTPPTPAPVDTTFPSQPNNPSSPVFTVPGLTPSEQVQVAQCINKWGKVPFTGTFTNVKRIKASVSVYGIGNVINDVTQTAKPMLVLIDAGVNVMGNPIYNLLNNNGYYCMKVNVNVKTDLDINLACNAKLADNSVQVNVASEVNSETSVIGVNVGSNVHVTRMTPSRAECAY